MNGDVSWANQPKAHGRQHALASLNRSTQSLPGCPCRCFERSDPINRGCRGENGKKSLRDIRGGAACYNRDTASLDRLQNQPKWGVSGNRFRDPDEKLSEIKNLREFHDVMDRAVLEAYDRDVVAKNAKIEEREQW